jgi:aminoglycoside 6'-N-acetyltransferase I
MINIQPFELKYLDECVSLFLNVYSPEPWSDKWPSIDNAKKYLYEFIIHPRFKGFIVFEYNKIIGVCLGHKRTWWEGEEYFIDEMFIDIQKQRKGIGSSLMNHLEYELGKDGINNIALFTKKNYPAEHFYLKCKLYVDDSIIYMVLKDKKL